MSTNPHDHPSAIRFISFDTISLQYLVFLFDTIQYRYDILASKMISFFGDLLLDDLFLGEYFDDLFLGIFFDKVILNKWGGRESGALKLPKMCVFLPYIPLSASKFATYFGNYNS